MSSEIMQETIPLVECSAFHRGMSVLEASLRNTEDSEAIISGLLKGAAEFYGASRASVVEADWELGIGVITYEWCSDGIPAQRDMLQCLPMEKFPRWKKALKANKPLMISDLDGLAKSYPDEAAFFREYGVTTLLAAPFSKRINQGFIAVDDPTRYTDDPVFLFIASYAVVLELNEIKQQQSIRAATKASKYNPEDVHINFFGGMEIISPKGTLTGEDIKADQCYLLLAYLILNHKKNFLSVRWQKLSAHMMNSIRHIRSSIISFTACGVLFPSSGSTSWSSGRMVYSRSIPTSISIRISTALRMPAFS